MMDDIYYAVIKNGSTYTLEAFNIKKSTTTLEIGASPKNYLVHLDTKKEVAIVSYYSKKKTREVNELLGKNIKKDHEKIYDEIKKKIGPTKICNFGHP